MHPSAYPCAKVLIQVFTVIRQLHTDISQKPYKEWKCVAKQIPVIGITFRSDSNSLRELRYKTESALRAFMLFFVSFTSSIYYLINYLFISPGNCNKNRLQESLQNGGKAQRNQEALLINDQAFAPFVLALISYI